MDVMSLSFRPTKFSEVFGQEKVVSAIRKQVASRPPRCWMFTGAPGVGKTTLAQIMAVSYQCTHQKQFGEPCKDCIDNFNSFSIHNYNASDVNGVDEMRKVANLSQFKPIAGSSKRVILLSEAQRITKDAQNLLLDPTENTPSHTVWIICTTEPTKILAALQRRFTVYKLAQLSYGQVEEFLKKSAERAKIQRPLAPLLEQLCQTQVTPALVLQALEKYNAGLSEIECVSVEGSSVNTHLICKAVTSGNLGALKSALKDATSDDARWIRSSCGGWIKGFLNNAKNRADVERAVASLCELTAMAPLEDSLLLQWLWATLFKICLRYGR